MVTYTRHGKAFDSLDFTEIEERGHDIAKMIEERTGAGNDFLGWLDYASRLTERDIEDIAKTAEYIRHNYDALAVVGIGGSYLGARAAIEAIKGFFPDDGFEIIYVGNTLSSTYTNQVINHLSRKKFAINVISKSGTTTEPAVAFRLLKELLIEKYGKEYARKAIFATTDRAKGALKSEAVKEGYKTFVIPDDVGGRFSVITPVGLLPIACAGIDIRAFIKGVRDGEKDYSDHDYKKNPAYNYAANRYLLHKQAKFSTEMFVSYEIQEKMIEEWLKQLFDESEGKDGKALLCASGVFTTDLHSMGQFIQDGSPVLFETIIKETQPILDVTVPSDVDNLDNLNYLAGRKLSYINDKAYIATLDAHTSSHSPANVIEIEKMDAYNLGNLFYFFFRATAYSAYLLGVNPFNQPGVEIYKSNMFKLLGKPGYENK